LKVSRWGGLLGWCCLLGLVLLWGCRREVPSTFDSNLAPETYISRAPADSTLAYYRVHLYWNGADEDGQIQYFEYSVTDSNKVPGEDTPGFTGFYRTTLTDSLFALSADNPQILGHRFYVRAVDNEGKVDPTPAWAYFVANNFNFPNVTFKTQRGEWIDRSGNPRSITLRSLNRFNPTDTIGVGGKVYLSWTGNDVDDGGYVVGYEYRISASPAFIGGTLADTSLTLDFSPVVSGGNAQYFSGTEAIQVRAIDDAGAKTQPDSIRSVVVNFNPITWIVHPEHTDPPTRNVVFRERLTKKVYPSGTTLAFDEGGSNRGIEFFYTGFDDPRDLDIAPAVVSGITGFSFRKLKDGGGPAYKLIPNTVAYPGTNIFDVPETQNLQPADYLFLVRSKDVLERWGQPDTVRVSVNYKPFFTSVTYFTPGDAEELLWIPPTSGSYPDTVNVFLPKNTDGTYPDLRIRFVAEDNHFPPPDQDPLDINTVVETETSTVWEYRARLNGARDGFEDANDDGAGERVFAFSATGESGFIRSGLNRIELVARDAGTRTSTREVVFTVTLGQ
jgi:hypothetical protein